MKNVTTRSAPPAPTHLPGSAGRVLAAMLAVTLLAVSVAPRTAMAQEDPRPEDVATIDGIIAAYYEVVSGPAGERVDAARDRSLHHPDAWVAIANMSPEGERVVRVMTLADYHGSNAPRQQAFWEWETDRSIQRSGNMVHVWSSYASSRSPRGEVFAEGVNSITLFHDGDRWWIMGWMFDQAAGR